MVERLKPFLYGRARSNLELDANRILRMASLPNLGRSGNRKRIKSNRNTTSKTKYKTNSEGRLVYDSEGNPVKEPGFIERQLQKIPNILKNIALPGSPFSQKKTASCPRRH